MHIYSLMRFDAEKEDVQAPTSVFDVIRHCESPAIKPGFRPSSTTTTTGPNSPPPPNRPSIGATARPSQSPDLFGTDTGSRQLPGDANVCRAERPPTKAMNFFSADRIPASPALHAGGSDLAVDQTSHNSPEQQLDQDCDGRIQSPSPSDWTGSEIAEQLRSFYPDVKDGNSRLATYMLQSIKIPEWRVHTGRDLFAGIRIEPYTGDQGMRVKIKQHSKRREQREEHYKAVCIKTTKDRVPRYRFHHVEIKKNVLTPHTSLTFYPHLRDLKSYEEKKYSLWLKELEEFDLQSGFKPMNREEKAIRTAQSERARTLSLYLETWLERLAIPGCNKSTLIQCVATREPDDAITPQQKTDILKSQQRQQSLGPHACKGAEMFTDAFRQVFEDAQPPAKRILLRDVLFLDESVDNIMDSKPTAKDGSSPQNENEDDLAETNLATYCILGCLICFSHSCDHGEYDNTNCKHTFSISSSRYRLRDVLGQRRRPPFKQPTIANGDNTRHRPCWRNCYQEISGEEQGTAVEPFTEDETIVLRSLYTTADHSKVKKNPICLAAEFLNRNCRDVYKHFKELNLSLPPAPESPARRPPKSLSWYDRYKKVLMGDWQDHTVTHEHQRRDVIEPCFHHGPCAPKVCSCVDAGILCERFCGCTLESCAYKFNGCNCHSQGKICQRKHQEKSSTCICVQLNRECDPNLCRSCGAFERADPRNAQDDLLHSTGCQNCELQRGVSKALLLGQSQLDGVGYGLFTAEDIAQDEFVVEYVGELIVHDEGVRREARRGDVFDEESTVSYLFTLLENEGIWVDAAQYGNLSRYINHAPESEKRGCNITPRILYVNGEFRIKFTALRDIRAGEELFFNYGEEFPNLTKKLLDQAGESSATPRLKDKQSSRMAREDKPARKTPKVEARKQGRGRAQWKSPRSDVSTRDGVAGEDANRKRAPSGLSRKRKRRGDGSEGEEYQPAGLGVVSSRASDSDPESALSGPRLRKWHRSTEKLRESRTLLAQRSQPKTRGKRGGARPGSGRPRKHPRPGPPGAGRPAPAATGGPAQPHGEKAVEVASPPKPLPRETIDDAGPKSPDPREMEDGFEEHAGAMEDENEEEDAMVRKRHDRATRHRRLPKKYRECSDRDAQDIAGLA